MRIRIALLLLLAALILFVVWWNPPPDRRKATPVAGQEVSKAEETRPAPPSVSKPPVSLTGPVPTPSRSEQSRAADRRDFSNPLVPSSFQETSPPAATAPDSVAGPDFDKISVMLRNYRTIAGENPVGTNAEVMKAVMGGNPKGAMLGPPEGEELNEKGELIDRWGTPYFFHQLSKDLTEIHSAGPDRKMWTSDDIVGN